MPRRSALLLEICRRRRLRDFYGEDAFPRPAQQSETDPEVRLAELQRQRDGINAEMERIRIGNIKVMTAPEALDRFQQLTTLAKDLLADFREVEQNFRKLDRQAG